MLWFGKSISGIIGRIFKYFNKWYPKLFKLKLKLSKETGDNIGDEPMLWHHNSSNRLDFGRHSSMSFFVELEVFRIDNYSRLYDYMNHKPDQNSDYCASANMELLQKKFCFEVNACMVFAASWTR